MMSLSCLKHLFARILFGVSFFVVGNTSRSPHGVSRYAYDEKCSTTCDMQWYDGSNPNITVRGNCTVIRQTPICVQSLNSDETTSKTENFNHSTDTSLGTESKPRMQKIAYVYSPPEYGNLLKVIRLNLTATLLFHPSQPSPRALRMEMECLHGSPNEEFCIRHPNRPQGEQGDAVAEERKHWPCRLFDLRHPTRPHLLPLLPHTFNYKCLSAHSNTLIRINVSVPQICESHYYMKLTPPDNLEPSVDKTSLWLPVPVADMGNPEGIKIGYTEPPDYVNLTTIVIELLRGSETFQSVSVPYRKGSTYYLFKNVPIGQYEARLFPHIYSNSSSDLASSPNNYISIAFWFYDFDRMDTSTVPDSFFRDAGPPLLISLCAIVVSVLLCSLMAWVFIRYRRKWLRQNESGNVAMNRNGEVEFLSPSVNPTTLPLDTASSSKVIIVYSDDNEHHRKVVGALATLLSRNTNCAILFDEWALNAGTIQQGPDQWYYNSLAAANIYLVIFSEGAKEILKGKRISTQRHWDDWFSPAMTFILQQLLSDLRKRSPIDTEYLSGYVGLRLSYSPEDVVLPFFNQLPIHNLLLPKELTQLLRLLSPRTVSPDSQLNISGLSHFLSAVENAYAFHRTETDWLQGRILTENSNGTQQNLTQISSDLEHLLTFGSYSTQPTVSVRQAFAAAEENTRDSKKNRLPNGSAENFRLLSPDEVEDEGDRDNEGQPQFPLIGKPDDISVSSDSEIDFPP